MLFTAIAVVLGYLLGGIPTGVVVARAYGGVDLTAVGSKRTGATNVLRTLGKKAAALVFLGDFLKGCVAVLVGQLLAPGDEWPRAMAGFAAVVGHTFSPFLGFKGGRGVTTGLGSLLVLSPAAAGLAALVGLATIVLSRYVSLGSMLGSAAGGLALLAGTLALGQPPALAAFGVLVAVFIVAMHRDNLQRLASGTERRLGQRVEPG